MATAASAAGPAVIGKRVVIIVNSHNPSPNHVPIPTPIVSAKTTETLRLRLRLRSIPSATDTSTANHVVDEEEEEEEAALLLLRKSLLENQWNKPVVTCSTGSSARRRRRRRRPLHRRPTMELEGYAKGGQQQLLTHDQVLLLSKAIQGGVSLQHHSRRLAQKLGRPPSEHQLASWLKMSRAELRMKLMECDVATQKLAMGNIRLVISIARKYRNMGADMADLVQAGLTGLVRGIHKYDASKGFRFSTYVYWWIRQGVMRALVHNATIFRRPPHIYQRQCSIRNARLALRHKGVTASTQNVAQYLNMSPSKVRNATQANCKVISLDAQAFPSASHTLHSFIADDRLENNPWRGVGEWALKDEVNKLMDSTLSKREAQIIRLYYGLDNECLTWEDISKRIGLSRERVRQIGLVALERLKYAARKGRLEAMLVPHSFL